ncbi:MAG: type II toxin-antitoxin system HicA family toxin [Vulcanimicrobiaceae bacterium]
MVAALQRDGFVLSHTRGSHHYLRRPGIPRLVVVPVHASHVVPIGTLLSILRQAELTIDELKELLAH